MLICQHHGLYAFSSSPEADAFFPRSLRPQDGSAFWVTDPSHFHSCRRMREAGEGLA